MYLSLLAEHGGICARSERNVLSRLPRSDEPSNHGRCTGHERSLRLSSGLRLHAAALVRKWSQAKILRRRRQRRRPLLVFLLRDLRRSCVDGDPGKQVQPFRSAGDAAQRPGRDGCLHRRDGPLVRGPISGCNPPRVPPHAIGCVVHQGARVEERVYRHSQQSRRRQHHPRERSGQAHSQIQVK